MITYAILLLTLGALAFARILVLMWRNAHEAGIINGYTSDSGSDPQ